jgi:hypothetical protein
MTMEYNENIVKISLMFWTDDYWIAQYFNSKDEVEFDRAYKNPEEFAKDNDCYPAEIIELRFN